MVSIINRFKKMKTAAADLGDDNRLSADGIAFCFEMMPPEVLNAFSAFVKKNADRKWIIVSDYHLEKNSEFRNDVFVFTVLPAEQNFLPVDQLHAGLPCKLSQSKVRDDIILFLNELNHFTFAFALDKTLRPMARTHKEVSDNLDFTIQIMERWQNAADCTDIINQFKKFRQLVKSEKLDLRTYNHAILVANFAAAITVLIAKDVDVRSISWGSDRDKILELGGIAYSIFNVSLNAFLQQRNMPKIDEMCFFVESPAGVNGGRKPRLWFDAYIRVADYFAAPVANADFNRTHFRSNNSKYGRLLNRVVADSSKVFVLMLKCHAEGYGFSQVKVSCAPLTLKGRCISIIVAVEALVERMSASIKRIASTLL